MNTNTAGVAQKTDPKIDARLEATTIATMLPDVRPLTTDTLMALRAMLTLEQQRGCYLVLGFGAVNVLFGSPDLHKYIDPVSKHERLLVGEFGTMLGMDIHADCYKHPNLQRIPRTHAYVMAGDNSAGYGTEVTGPHTSVAVEEVRVLRERLAEIDAVPFDSILWTENGVPKDIPEQVRTDWKFCGLSNTMFPGYKHPLTRGVNESDT